MDQLIEGREYSFSAWEGSRFEMLRVSASTEKGNLGEDLLKEILIKIGFLNTQIKENRKGEWTFFY